jgi:hypothetical protein
MMKAQSEQHGKVTAAALLATASLIALLCAMPGASAEDCPDAGAAPPADIATPARLNDVLRAGTSAQLLAMNFLRKPIAEQCAWIYEVKVLTASGSVVELDFKADGLDLVGARGPENDRDAAALVKRLGGDEAVLNAGPKKGSGSGASGNASNGGKGGSQSGGGGEGGEGGSSGSGGGGSGGGDGGSGSDGGDHDGGDGGGGDGGDHEGGGSGPD